MRNKSIEIIGELQKAKKIAIIFILVETKHLFLEEFPQKLPNNIVNKRKMLA